jgi:serine/threonine protein kinase
LGSIQHTDNIPLQGIRTIPFSELTVSGVPLASGSFKSVYKATWSRPGSAHALQVAVLVLRHGGGSFAEEIRIIELLGQHQHLVKLLAVSMKPPTGDMCMVCEFAQRGSFDCVLQELAEKEECAANAVLLTAALQVWPLCLECKQNYAVCGVTEMSRKHESVSRQCKGIA